MVKECVGENGYGTGYGMGWRMWGEGCAVMCVEDNKGMGVRGTVNGVVVNIC